MEARAIVCFWSRTDKINRLQVPHNNFLTVGPNYAVMPFACAKATPARFGR
jgi:hypothetical protein